MKDTIEKYALQQENVKKRKAAGKTAEQRFQDFLAGQRMTAGNVFKFGQCILDKPILEYRREKESAKLQEKVDVIKTTELVDCSVLATHTVADV